MIQGRIYSTDRAEVRQIVRTLVPFKAMPVIHTRSDSTAVTREL